MHLPSSYCDRDWWLHFVIIIRSLSIQYLVSFLFSSKKFRFYQGRNAPAQRLNFPAFGMGFLEKLITKGKKNDIDLFLSPLSLFSCSLIHMARAPDALLDNKMTLEWKSFLKIRSKKKKIIHCHISPGLCTFVLFYIIERKIKPSLVSDLCYQKLEAILKYYNSHYNTLC